LIVAPDDDQVGREVVQRLSQTSQVSDKSGTVRSRG